MELILYDFPNILLPIRAKKCDINAHSEECCDKFSALITGIKFQRLMYFILNINAKNELL